MGRRTSLAWLVAVIAGVFMVVPTLANAQEQGSTEADLQLTDEVTGDEPTTTEDPAAETPPAEPTTDPVAPAEPTEPAPVEPTEPADASKAPEPAASSETSAPAPAEAAAPAPEPADVSAADAKATSSPGNDGSGRASAATRVGSDSGDLKATVESGSKEGAGCAARGGAGEVHNTFPDDGSCVQSQFQGGLPSTEATAAELTVDGVTFDIWEDPEGTVNFTVTAGGPFTGAFYVKGGPLHNQCVFTAVTSGSCLVPDNPQSGNQAGFSHLDVCVGENPPPPPPPDIPETPVTPETPGVEDTPEDQDVLTEEERDQREEQEELEEELEELRQAPPVPTAVTTAPEEALPFTGLDTGWLVLMSLGLLGSGVLLRRKVS